MPKPLIGVATLAIVALVFSVLALSRGTSQDHLLDEPNFPAGGPAEFLYLDTARAAAYLAQVNGGTFDSQTLTQKLSENLEGKLAVQGVGEAGGSKASERSIEREVKPTAASLYFALFAALEDADEGGLERINLRKFTQDVRPLPEGQFVRFQTRSLASPIYLNAYLAVRNGAVKAIFPESEQRQEAAKAFKQDVGRAPRVVFSLQPLKGSDDESASFVYMMPMNAELLTDERSLLKHGGGQFTVVGKAVRTFPEPGQNSKPAYVDSPTRETWEQPLKHAPGELLCRTEPRCAGQVRKNDLTDRERRKAIRRARRRAVKALRTQTAIGYRGAVIIPVAIYK